MKAKTEGCWPEEAACAAWKKRTLPLYHKRWLVNGKRSQPASALSSRQYRQLLNGLAKIIVKSLIMAGIMAIHLRKWLAKRAYQEVKAIKLYNICMAENTVWLSEEMPS